MGASTTPPRKLSWIAPVAEAVVPTCNEELFRVMTEQLLSAGAELTELSSISVRCKAGDDFE